MKRRMRILLIMATLSAILLHGGCDQQPIRIVSNNNRQDIGPYTVVLTGNVIKVTEIHGRPQYSTWTYLDGVNTIVISGGYLVINNAGFGYIEVDSEILINFATSTIHVNGAQIHRQPIPDDVRKRIQVSADGPLYRAVTVRSGEFIYFRGLQECDAAFDGPRGDVSVKWRNGDVVLNKGVLVYNGERHVLPSQCTVVVDSTGLYVDWNLVSSDRDAEANKGVRSAP